MASLQQPQGANPSNRFASSTAAVTLSASSAPATKATTPCKITTSTGATSLVQQPQVKQSLVGIAAQQNSPNTEGGGLSRSMAASSATLPKADLDNQQHAHGSGTASQLTVTSLKNPMAQSQVSLRNNLFAKPQSKEVSGATPSGGYQPSYLREATHKHSIYQSHSPLKHTQPRFNPGRSASKFNQAFGNSTSTKRQSETLRNKTGEQSKTSLRRNETSSALSSAAGKTQTNQVRSGSHYVGATKKSQYGGGSSLSKSRGGAGSSGLSAAQARLRQQQQPEQEYSGSAAQSNLKSQRSSQTRPQVESSFTRLHQGNSSVVRTFERKQLLQQSSSQVRKMQQANERISTHHSSTKLRNSNQSSQQAVGHSTYSASRPIPGQTTLFSTRDRSQNNAVQSHLAQHYASSTSSSLHHNAANQPQTSTSALPMDSDRTADSNSGARSSANGGNRSKGQKQPRQSKSTTGPKNPSSSQSNQRLRDNSSNTTGRAASTILTGSNNASISNLGILSPQMTPTASTRLNASVSMNHVLTANQLPMQSSGDQQSRPQGGAPAWGVNAGLESSLSFTRRLIEETAQLKARQEAAAPGQTNTSGRPVAGPETDIGDVSLQIQSNLTAQGQNESIKTTARKKPQSSLEISTGPSSRPPHIQLSNKFVSPKLSTAAKPSALTASKMLIHNSITSPMNNSSVSSRMLHQSSLTLEKKSSAHLSSSNSALKAHPSTHTSSTKIPAPGQSAAQAAHALNSAFSPDKRPNVSRSQQMQNNLYFKRGQKTTAQGAGDSRNQGRDNSRTHQRMFGGNQNQFSIAPQHEPSPQKSGPGYLQSTFSHAKKAAQKSSNTSNVYAYQIGRVRANHRNQASHLQSHTAQQLQSVQSSATMPTQNQPSLASAVNTNSLKDLQASVKVLDQGSPRAVTLTQSHGPIKSHGSALRQGSQITNNSAKPSKKSSKQPVWNTSSSLYSAHKALKNGGSAVKNTSHLARDKRPGSKRGSTVDQHASIRTTAPARPYTKGGKASVYSSGKTTLVKEPSAQQQSQQQLPPSKTRMTITEATNDIIKSDDVSSGNNDKDGATQQPSRDSVLEPVGKEDDINGLTTKLADVVVDPYRSGKASFGEAPSSSSQDDNRITFVESGVFHDLQASKASRGGDPARKSVVITSSASAVREGKKVSRSSSSIVDSSIMATVPLSQQKEASYKLKQDSIIEMIQSNMKRSEDIQQSLAQGRFFDSVKKKVGPGSSCRTSMSNQSNGTAVVPESKPTLVDLTAPNCDPSKEYQPAQPAVLSINSSPKVAKEPQTLQAANEPHSSKEPEAQVPLLSTKSPSPSKQSASFASQTEVATVSQEIAPEAQTIYSVIKHDREQLRTPVKEIEEPLSPVEREESLKVEDVFNDAEIVEQKDTNSAKTTQVADAKEQRTSVASEIQPAQQPGENLSSSENVVSDLGSPRLSSTTDKEPKQETQKPQSAFALALANKKQQNQQSMEAASSPIGLAVQEISPQLLKQEITSAQASATNALPMCRKAFKNLFSLVMTDQERREIDSLSLTNDTVYYCNDIMQRTDAKQAILNTDDEDGYYVMKPHDQILYRFEVLKVLGKGSFAQVVSAIDHLTGKKVAVKVNRNTEIDHKFAEQEGKLLQFLMDEDPKDENNIVRMVEHIRFRDHQCFVFELLNTDLFEHLKETDFIGFDEDQIRSYATQLLKALVFLEERSVIHCDLKPENILCVDADRQLLKVVDFGSGCLTSEQVYTYVQSRYYRAPEVILRIPYSEKVDIWSLGCILAELYTGEPLFPGNNEQEQLEFIMELQGMFPESMIDKSRKKDHYFDADYSPFLIEDPRHGILRIPESRHIQEAIPSKNMLFLDFVHQCLTLDPEVRPGAAEAMEHPWIKSEDETDKQEQSLAHLVSQQVAKDRAEAAQRSFEIPQVTQEMGPSVLSGYTPLRKRPEVDNAHNVNKSMSLHESLDLQNEMHMSMVKDFRQSDAQTPQRNSNLGEPDYYEGRLTESDRALTEPEFAYQGAAGNVSNFNPFVDQVMQAEDEAALMGGVKGSTASQSRQREEAGARASAAEISPDRPQFIGNQRMTSFVAAQQSLLNSSQVSHDRQSNPATGGITLYQVPPMTAGESSPERLSASKMSLHKSPLKPSNDSLLEHYKYEQRLSKQSHNGSSFGVANNGSTSQMQLQELIAKGEGIIAHQNAQQDSFSSAKKELSATKGPLATAIEEPKIISMTSSFTSQTQTQPQMPK